MTKNKDTGPPGAPAETLHATCIAIDGWGVLLHGASGAGKSDLALRLIDRGAALVSDDYTRLAARDGRLLATPPDTISGLIEVRGLGLVPMPHLDEAEVRLLVLLDEPVPRMPDAHPLRRIAGIDIPLVTLAALEPSAPIKVELALRRLIQGEATS